MQTEALYRKELIAASSVEMQCCEAVERELEIVCSAQIETASGY